MTTRLLVRRLLAALFGLLTLLAAGIGIAALVMVNPPAEDALLRVEAPLQVVAIGDARHHTGHRLIIGTQPAKLRFDLLDTDRLQALSGQPVAAALDPGGDVPEVLALQAAGETLVAYRDSRAQRLSDGYVFTAFAGALALLLGLLTFTIWRRL